MRPREAQTSPDWTALPLRVERCLGRARALALLDVPPCPDGSSGRDFQEEYLEWRVVRRPCSNHIERVELSTELPEHWRIAAAADPAAVLRTVGAFAGEPAIPVSTVFGTYDPFASRATAKGREQAFAATMLDPGPRSPYNDGRRAICCMTHPTNTLGALETLASAASKPWSIQAEGGTRPRAPTAAELMPKLGSAAQSGRASDPVLVERLARLAFEGRTSAFVEPVGVWVVGVQHTRLHTPAGDPVPASWFRLSRPLHESHAGSTVPPRPQRLVLEVPAGEGFAVSDLVDIATEERLRHGGQVAELVQLAVTFRVGPPNDVSDPPTPIAVTDERHDFEGCEELRLEGDRVMRAAQAPS